MNTTIMNPVASVAAMTRPVLPIDIAAKLGLSLNTVKQYLSPNYPWGGKGVQLVRKTADEMGYDPKAALSYTGSLQKGKSRIHDLSNAPEHIEGPVTLKKIAESIGVSVPTVHRAIKKQKGSIWELAMKYGYENSHDPAVIERKAKEKAERKAQEYYRNTPFHSIEEQKKYMLYLREKGYGNTAIAKMSGLARNTVRRNIGATPADLAKHNRQMGMYVFAQKNAARQQYVLNKPIREYNKRVEEHNKMKAQIAQMEAELKPQTPIIEQAAKQKITFPMIDLSTVQPTALQ